MKEIHLLGLSGSLRRQSKNTGLLRAAASHLPPQVTLEIADLSSLPLFNPDVSERPEPVERLFHQAAKADAFVFACPEFNYSLAPALKNALDWMSREKDNRLLNDKAASIMGAGGASGTARAQYHLRQVGVYLNLHFLNKPEVMCNAFAGGFNADGDVVDATLQTLIQQQVEALVRWTRRIEAT